MLAQDILYNDETLGYIEHILYRLENKKIVFEYHWPINSRLSQPIFNYLKFYIISHFIQYIWDYSSVVNYNITPGKTVYEYLLKTFYNRINKKQYNLQIWQHNICHTNIIAMKDMIISEKAKEEETLWKGIINTIVPVQITQILSFVDLARRYNWAISNANLDAAKKLGLTGIKKYWRRTGQIEIELDWLYDWIPILATFVRHLYRVYNNKKVGQNMSVRQNINSE